MGLTVKQERFVQGLFKGLSQRRAYKESYSNNMSDTTIDNNAYKLMQNNEILTRLKELQQEEESKNKWTVERMINEFEDLKKITRQAGEFSASIKALENIGKLMGMYVEHNHITGNLLVEIVDDTDEFEDDDYD